MRDQEIYTAIAQLLVDEKPDEACTRINLLVHVQPYSSTVSVWTAEKLDRNSSFGLSTPASNGMDKLFRELQGYYKTNSLGEWNVAHFTLEIPGSSFNIDFDNCAELDNGELHWYEYYSRYQ